LLARAVADGGTVHYRPSATGTDYWIVSTASK
jgi:hypothetical protein